MVRRHRIAAALLVVVAASATAATGSAQPAIEVVISDLSFITNLAPSPDGRLFIAEKDTGAVRIVRDGALVPGPFATVRLGSSDRETGLLGLALHPAFPDEPWVYVYFSGDDGRNVLARIRADGDVGSEPEVLLAALPTTAGYHNGGDLAFGRDGMLYVSTGEAHDPDRAQDPDDLAGKILRLEPDGSVPSDNPSPGSPVYALGIRNSFGLCVDPVRGTLWETENGPDRDDEVNVIRAGANYGWPTHTGAPGADGFQDAVVTWSQVIAPTGCAVSADGSTLYVGDYGGNLRAIDLDGDEGVERGVIATFDDGITDVARTADGSLLVASGGTVHRLTVASAGPDGTPSPAPTVSPMPPPASAGGGIVGVAVIAGLVAALLWQMRRLRDARITPGDA